MTDSSPQEIRQPEPPTRRAGFRLRFFLLIAFPCVLLGLAGAYLLWIGPRALGAVSPTDFLLAFAGAVALALVLAALLAHLTDAALRHRLADIERALARGSRGADSLRAAERQWPGLRELNRAAHEALSRSDDRLQDGEELKALQRAADDLQERVRGWAETEIAPSFEAAGPLAELSLALQTLVRHLEERFGEAREVTDLARQSMAEACESIERASRESGRSAREIASLLTAAGEVRRLGAELTQELRETTRRAPKPADAPPPPPAPEPELEVWRERVGSLGSRLESLEKHSLRAALELAAEGIAERREAGPWLDRVETLRHVALGARALREEANAIAESAHGLGAARKPVPVEPVAIPVEIVAMAERVEQWGSDAYSRSERLSVLAQRLASEFAAATGLARTGAEELAGLAARFETRGQAHAADEGGGEVSVAWPAGARPLRLLTRDDIVPEEDEVPADRSEPADG